jgi:hypothetical protein
MLPRCAPEEFEGLAEIRVRAQLTQAQRDDSSADGISLIMAEL